MTQFTKKTAKIMGAKGGTNYWSKIDKKKRSEMMTALVAKREAKKKHV